MAQSREWLLYGAYGYTGRLIVAQALEQGLRPVLSGRDSAQVQALAAETGLEARPVGLGDPAALRRALEGIELVLHAAGPFVETAAPMVEACLAAGAHYLDITGEIPVFQESFAQDAAARRAGVVVMSGVGFDVVPTDCMARYVADQLDAPTRLDIGICTTGSPSAGTLKSMVEQLPTGGRVRRGGALLPYPLGRGARTLRFPHGERLAMPIPWGDLVTAYSTTGIGDITTYMAYPPSAVRAMRFGSPVVGLALRSGRLRGLLKGQIAKRVTGPDAAQLEAAKGYIWARARDGAGREAEAWLELGGGYTFTAQAAVLCVERVLGGAARPGACTPAGSFGADFVLQVPGTTRYDTV